jgi:beta-1,4-N-acetylglucosaminyltransferase
MIFVSVGTHEAPFDRLLRAVHELEVDEELIVQFGTSQVRGERAVEFEYLPYDRVVHYVQRARAVVIHAGVGSVMLTLANGKRPIVMPRLRRFGEHVDDHQQELASRLDAAGLVRAVDGREALEARLTGADEPPAPMAGIPWLGTALAEYLAAELGDRHAVSAPKA